MDAQFESVAFDVINQFMERIADRCLVPQDKLWSLWRDMYHDFPTKNKKKAVKEDKVVEKTIVVEKPVIVEKTVVVEKPVIIEKTIVVEKPVIVEKIVLVEKPVEKPVADVKVVEKEEKPITSVETVDTPVEKHIDPVVAPVVVTPVVVTPVVVAPVKEKTPPKKEKKEKEGCQFIITRGERSGMPCSAGVPRRDPDLGPYCKNHAPK